MEQYFATSDKRSAEFMKELLALCEKYKVAIVPSNSNGPDLHDSMIIVKHTEFIENYYKYTGITEKLD